MDKFKVSVVIPFYNAREYVSQAVESALEQPETAEVILVEDNSPDGGLELCKRLAKKYNKVKLFRHPDGKNHGAAASRNVGITYSQYPYISFLDADDYYLPNRFLKTAEVFTENKDAEGVYEAIGATLQDGDINELWKKSHLRELTTITMPVSPQMLFENILLTNIGTFSFDGFTAKRNLLFKVGLFNEKLEYFEDTELMIKLSANGLLFPGSIEKPIAVRRVHKNNRITYLLANDRKSFLYDIALWESLIDWGKKKLPYKKQILLYLHYVARLHKSDYFNNHKLEDFCSSRLSMLKIAFDHPRLFLEKHYWMKAFPSRTLLKF